MRKMFIENLPKRQGRNRKEIDWKNTIGYKVKFVYDDIEGEVEIIDYENLHAWHIAFSQQFYKEYNEKILQLEERLSELELEISILKK